MYTFFKRWALIFCMLGGVVGYLAFSSISFFDPVRSYAMPTVRIVQPLLIFAMLFIAFCKVELHDVLQSVHRSQGGGWCRHVLWAQTLGFLLPWLVLLALTLAAGGIGRVDMSWRLALETAFLCFLCPTATAASVVTMRLGGKPESLLAYTIMVNLVVTFAVPTLMPFVTSEEHVSFLSAFTSLLGKVFPMLVLPIFCAALVRHWMPRFHAKVQAHVGLAFKLWCVCLTLAVAVATRGLVQTHTSAAHCLLIAAVSLVACLVQFGVGRHIGARFGASVAACQAFGQKNTALAIWMGYTFLHPASALAGGFYAIWHNLFNAWQLNHVKS